MLDTVRNSYVLDGKNINVMTYFGSGNDFGTIYGGSSDDDGKVYAYSGSPEQLIYRFKSQFDAGTTDSVVVYGDENSPKLELGWGITIDSITFDSVTIDSATYASAIIDRPSTTGKWWSAPIRVSAKSLNNLYWNEQLGAGGDITFALRTFADSTTPDTAAWSDEYTQPQGSDVSAVQGNTYLQARASFSTNDITKTPVLVTTDNFTWKLSYYKEGATSETNILSVWESGFNKLENVANKSRLKRIEVYYEGTSGTMTIGYKSGDGWIDNSFEIDLSVSPEESTTDQYDGTTDNKRYTYEVPLIDTNDRSPIADYWQFSVTENGNVSWKVNKLNIYYDIEEYY